MLCDRCNFYFSFWATFYPPPTNNPKNKKKLKNEKNTWRYYFPQVYQKLGATWCKVPEIWCAMDGQTDRKKKKTLEVRVSEHLKKLPS